MIDENHRVPVRDEIVHDVVQPDDIRRMKPDRRLVQNVKRARRSVAHRSRELHTLTLTRRKRPRRAVERQIRQPQLHEPPRDRLEGFDHALRHRSHLGRHDAGNAPNPIERVDERLLADLIQGQSHNARRPRFFRKARAMTLGADGEFQKLLDALHPLLVFDLRERVLDRVRRVEIRKVHLARDIRRLRLIEDMLLLRRPVQDDILLLRGERAVRHVGSHAHRAADVGHERPHQRVPRRDRPFVDRQRFVGHERRFVDDLRLTDPVARRARALRVERQLFRARSVELFAAFRADDRQLRRDVHRRSAVVTVRAAVAPES